MMVDNLPKTLKTDVKDFIKGEIYYLTYDYFPNGGKPVKFKKFVKEGRKRYALLTLSDKQEVFVRDDLWLFTKPFPHD